MYKSQKTQQLTFQGFNQSCGTPLDQDDEWVVLADRIDWRAVELEYQQSFKSGRGRPAVPARQAFGALIIQKRTGLSDRELIKKKSPATFPSSISLDLKLSRRNARSSMAFFPLCASVLTRTFSFVSMRYSSRKLNPHKNMRMIRSKSRRKREPSGR